MWNAKIKSILPQNFEGSPQWYSSFPNSSSENSLKFWSQVSGLSQLFSFSVEGCKIVSWFRWSGCPVGVPWCGPVPKDCTGEPTFWEVFYNPFSDSLPPSFVPLFLPVTTVILVLDFVNRTCNFIIFSFLVSNTLSFRSGDMAQLSSRSPTESSSSGIIILIC